MRIDMIKRASAVFAAAMLALTGCSGEDGDPGAQGAPGQDGAPGDTGPQGPAGPIGEGISTTETCVLCHGAGSIADPEVTHGLATLAPAPYTVAVTSAGLVDNGTDTRLEVELSVSAGTNPVTTIASGNLRLNLSRLQPAAGGEPSEWVNYVRDADSTRPTTERNGTLTNNNDGTYTYRFVTDVVAGGYDASSTDSHRISGQISGTGLVATNIVHDFVPGGGAVSVTREIVATAACNGCHGNLRFHGSRYDVRYCVTCHNPGRGDGTTAEPAYVRDGEILGDMTVMAHKIHMGNRLSKTGYDYAGVEFDHIGYPQDPRNCTTCHTGADGDNWKNNPSVQACQSCHDNVSFVNPPPTGMVLHTAGARLNGSCTGCHDAATIEGYHLTPYTTPNNVGVPTGLANFEYVIESVTVNANSEAVVTFRIAKDGADLDLTTYPPTGFTGGPSFLVAYASPQDDVAAPRDWNQLGRTAGQPASVTVASVIGAATNNADGTFTATLSSAPFPASAVMRGVALQGYFTQTVGVPASVGTTSARHTPSAFKGVTGDPQRRVAVNNAKCLSCHEMLDLHGGNRVNNVQVCVVCHNPNLSSSGRSADPALVQSDGSPELLAAPYNGDPLLFPEDSQNLKDMVHGIHGASKRDLPYVHVRNFDPRSVTLYDWSHVTYPNEPSDCLACHDEGQYDADLPAGLLMTTTRTTTGAVDETRDDVLAARASVPNATDEVKNVTTAACSGCHTSFMSTAHMESMGAGFGTRGDALENR